VTDALGRQLLGVIAVMALGLGPAAIATWFLLRRKRAARRARKSPLSADLLRPPGHALRERIDDMRWDMSFDLGLLLFVPMFPLAYLHVQSLITGRTSAPWVLGLSLAVAGAFLIYQVRKMLGNAAIIDRLRLGLDAEMAVGQELDQLMREGAAVFHDFPADAFNIDHVVIAREGVFAVETKGYSKPNRGGGKADATVTYDGQSLTLPDSAGRKAIEQAERQARWLSDWLRSSTGEPVHVTPVLALPGWWVNRTGRGHVLVFSGKELREHLFKARTATPLTPDQMQRIVHQVEQKCRSVAPSYRPDED
jgi:hypothetical protein